MSADNLQRKAWLANIKGLHMPVLSAEIAAEWAKSGVTVYELTHQPELRKALDGYRYELESVRREKDFWRVLAATLQDHGQSEFWAWQGDGMDHLESMVDGLTIAISADQLRQLLQDAKAPAMPPETLQVLADTGLEDHHDDNGPGRVVCPSCHAHMPMQWAAGLRNDLPSNFVHDPTCPAEWARNQLKDA